jgi:hypothetical protein
LPDHPQLQEEPAHGLAADNHLRHHRSLQVGQIPLFDITPRDEI